MGRKPNQAPFGWLQPCRELNQLRDVKNEAAEYSYLFDSGEHPSRSLLVLILFSG